MAFHQGSFECGYNIHIDLCVDKKTSMSDFFCWKYEFFFNLCKLDLKDGGESHGNDCGHAKVN